MKRIAVTLLVMTVWALSAVPGFAREQSLAELVLEAVGNNAEIQAIRESVKGLDEASVYAGALPNPVLGVGLANLPVDTLDLNQEPMTQKQVSITQRFPWPGKRGLAAETQSLASQKAQAQLTGQVLSLQKQVSEVYYDLWFVTESIRLNEEFVELVSQSTRASASRYGAGREMQRAVLTGELELSRLADQKLALEGRRRMLEVTMNRLLQREMAGEVTVDTELNPPQRLEASAWLARAEKRNPRLALLDTSVAQSRVAVSLAEKAALPDVAVKLAYGQRDEDPMGRSRDDFLSLSASIPLPVWKAKREDRLVASKRAGERAALLNYQGFRRELPHLIDGLATDLGTALDRHHFYREELVPRAKHLADALVSRYEVGGSSYTDMIEAVINAMKAELTARKYLRDALVAQAKLMELTGGLFPGVAPFLTGGE